MDNGFILLSRSILDSEVFASQKLLKIWLWCLLKANHKNAFVPLTVGDGETTISIKRGQFIFGRFKAEEELCIDGSTIYKLMKKLEEMGNINISSNNRYSIVTINNYNTYQDAKLYKVAADEQQSNSRVAAEEQQSNTNKNDKNDNNDKKKDKISDKNYKTIFDEVSEEFELSDDLKQIFLVWFKYKAEKKQSYQPTGMRTLIKTKLLETSGNPEKLKDMVLFSISNNYQGLFQRTNNNGNGKSKSTDEGIAAIAKQYFPEEV